MARSIAAASRATIRWRSPPSTPWARATPTWTGSRRATCRSWSLCSGRWSRSSPGTRPHTWARRAPLSNGSSISTPRSRRKASSPSSGAGWTGCCPRSRPAPSMARSGPRSPSSPRRGARCRTRSPIGPRRTSPCRWQPSPRGRSHPTKYSRACRKIRRTPASAPPETASFRARWSRCARAVSARSWRASIRTSSRSMASPARCCALMPRRETSRSFIA